MLADNNPLELTLRERASLSGEGYVHYILKGAQYSLCGRKLKLRSELESGREERSQECPTCQLKADSKGVL